MAIESTCTAAAQKGHSYTVDAAFDTTVALVTRLLEQSQLCVAGEFTFKGEDEQGTRRRTCTVLLVDSPMLLLQSMVLDPAAAAFIPAHVVITEEWQRTHVYWLDPSRTLGARLPPAAKTPIERLYRAIGEALTGLSNRECTFSSKAVR